MIVNLPRIPLVHAPTPLQRLERVSRHTGVDFWMKRDDLTGDLGLGGNKVRKLEFLLGQALAEGATCLLTTGGPQSNHARATAAAAARLGLKCVLVLAGRDPGTRDGNLLLDQLFGAEIRFPGAVTPGDQARCLQEAAAEAAAAGERPFVIPVGGSTALGALGTVTAYNELAAAMDAPDWVCCASGSGGTQAGLALGAWLHHGSQTQVQGFSVWQPEAWLRPVTEEILQGAARLLDRPAAAVPLHMDDGYRGPRYGVASEGGQAAIGIFARLEGILLDHVYTAKAMAGVLDYIRTGKIAPGARVVFVHTGGAPALFSSTQ